MLEYLSSIQFTYPVALWSLPVSLLLLTLGLRPVVRHLHSWASLNRSQQHQSYHHPLATLLLKLQATRQTKTSAKMLRVWFAYAVLLVLLHITLAQPYRLGEKLPEPPQYRDIIFLVDTSVSMMLRDYLVQGQRTARMDVVKSVLQHFIKGLAGSRLGLLVFSEQAYSLVPLTTDHELLKYQLQRLQPASLTGRRTDPGKALLYILNELQPRLRAGDRPVLVMLTDANRPVRDIDPRSAAALVKQQGLHLHTIAMGAGSESAKENVSSSLIYQPANVKLLQEMARAGGGDFFWADSQHSLNLVLSKIQHSEKQQSKVEPVFIHVALYSWPLLLAIGWIMLWQTLPLTGLRS